MVERFGTLAMGQPFYFSDGAVLVHNRRSAISIRNPLGYLIIEMLSSSSLSMVILPKLSCLDIRFSMVRAKLFMLLAKMMH